MFLCVQEELLSSSNSLKFEYMTWFSHGDSKMYMISLNLMTWNSPIYLELMVPASDEQINMYGPKILQTKRSFVHV